MASSSLRPFDAAPPLAPDDLFALKYIRDARLSPAGHIAYAMSYTEGENERFVICVGEPPMRNVQRLPFHGNATAPRWSPDGKWLAFIADGRLRVAELPSLTVSEPLTPEKMSVQGAPSWSPDSSKLAVSLIERRAIQGPRRITSAHYRAEGVGFTDDLTQRIALVDRSQGLQRFITTTADGLCLQPEWSPCGRRLLFLSTDNAVPISSYSPRLMTIGIEDGLITALLDEHWFIAAARWLPCGERVAVCAVRDSTLTVPNTSLWIVDLHGNTELRTPEITAKIGGMLHHDMPVWDLTRGNPITVLDQHAVFITVLRAGNMEVWRVALHGPISIQTVLAGERACFALDASVERNRLLYAVTDLHTPTELWTAQLDGRSEQRLTDLNGTVLDRWPAMRVEKISCPSDGLQIDVRFMAAAHDRGPLPTVLFIHGGPFASTGHAFRYDFHLLASHGFGVLFANFRGSAGYGDAFSRAIMGDWGAHGYPDHMAAVDAAIARGWADPARLGVWGPSHGGFATCWIVGHTARFKAAVAEAASTNFTTAYYLKDGPDVIARDLGGRPHEIPDIYRTRSPITYAHRCTTPTLFVHGADDLRCPVSEAEQFYRVLHDVGCKTELVLIPNCNHMGDSCGPLSARLAQNEALLRWFQTHL